MQSMSSEERQREREEFLLEVMKPAAIFSPLSVFANPTLEQQKRDGFYQAIPMSVYDSLSLSFSLKRKRE